MSVVTKAGTLAVFARFAYAALPADRAARSSPDLDAGRALDAVGNLGALAQTDMKRLLAYSGIAQVGYIVTAFAGQTALGLRYAILYLAGYTFMNLGAFAVVELISRDGDAVIGLGALRGARPSPPVAGCCDDVLPDRPRGLTADDRLHREDPDSRGRDGAGYAWLAGVLIAGTAISAYVYFKIVRAMFVPVDDAHVRDERVADPLPWIVVGVCAAATFVLGLFRSPRRT